MVLIFTLFCVHGIALPLLLCEEFLKVWDKLFQWWGLGLPDAFNIKEMVLHGGNSVMSKTSKLLWNSAVWVTCYLVWKNKNTRIFKGKFEAGEKFFQDVQLKSYEWINRRSTKGGFEWQQWVNSPNLCKFAYSAG